MEPKTVTITEADYKELVESRELLMALEEHGVDNWSGYSDAVAEFYGEFDE